jgi:hypothetical protein
LDFLYFRQMHAETRRHDPSVEEVFLRVIKAFTQHALRL